MATTATANRDAITGTRRLIVEQLKQAGPQTADGLAEGLGVSAMAVRQHLYALAELGWVNYDELPGAVGRPAKQWRLTEHADPMFPDRHADLAVSLIDSLKGAFGPSGMQRLLEQRAADQIKAYRRRLPKGATWQRRVRALAKLRSEEGYMAQAVREADGSMLLIENHCPICFAAKACSGLCSNELDVFTAVLGKRVRIERTEHMLEGSRRCAYRVTRA